MCACAACNGAVHALRYVRTDLLLSHTVQCRDLPLLDNGAISYSYEADKTGGRLNGSVASYTCREGLQLSAEDESRVCNNGVWTGSVPECTVVECEYVIALITIIAIDESVLILEAIVYVWNYVNLVQSRQFS